MHQPNLTIQQAEIISGEMANYLRPAVLRTWVKNVLFKSSAMTLNYESEESRWRTRLDASTKPSLLARLNVGLGKTHGPALAEDARSYLGAATEYDNLSDRTMTRRDLVSGGGGNALLSIGHD